MLKDIFESINVKRIDHLSHRRRGYIGGYQPAQKWLKDRKGRTLSNLDIEHYQKIIVSLVETDQIMKETDKIDL